MADYYGAPEASDNKTLRDRCRDLYAPEDFVTVINIDTSPITYQFMPPEHQKIFQPAPYAQEIHNVKPPKRVTLQPGETKLCPAYEADLMIEALVKQITSKRTQRKIDAGELEPRLATSNWSDPQIQISLIKDIFQGKQDLVSKYNEGLNEPKEPARLGRPPKAAEGV